MGLPISGKAHEAQGGGAFTWFIYGSSLDREAFAAWGNEHGYRKPTFEGAFPARLDGYRLSFDVVSRFWGGAVGSLTPAPGEHVEGLALPLAGDARGLVDHKEGAISGLYEAFAVELIPAAPTQAYAYRAAPSRRLAKEQPPSVSWLETVIRGARESGLGEAWIASLSEKLPR
jgi:hypothetical protein